MIRLPAFPSRRSVTSRPPSRTDIRRNDLALFLAVVLLMGAGWLILRWSAPPAQTITLGAPLPELHLPAGWIVSTATGSTLAEARNPASASPFASSLRIEATPAQPEQTLDSARAAVALTRSREFDRYRELAAEAVTVLDGQPALLVTYAWLADPTRDSGVNGLPVVVQAQELLFRAGDQWIAVTTAADATTFAQEQPVFEPLFAAFGLQRSAH